MASYGLSDDGEDKFRLILEARRMARAGAYVEALETLQESIAVAENGGQKLIAAIALNNIAEIHRLQGNTALALNYYRQALDTYILIGNQNGMATTRQRIDGLLLQAGDVKMIPVSKRETLLHDAIEQIRNRLKDQQEKGETPDTGETEYATYTEGVKKAIVRVWSYPEAASQNREEGKVKVEFTILRDGQLEDVRILRSSGHDSIDREAIRAVKAAAPFHRIPEQLGLTRMSIEFTFNYILEISHEGPAKDM